MRDRQRAVEWGPACGLIQCQNPQHAKSVTARSRCVLPPRKGVVPAVQHCAREGATAPGGSHPPCGRAVLDDAMNAVDRAVRLRSRIRAQSPCRNLDQFGGGPISARLAAGNAPSLASPTGGCSATSLGFHRQEGGRDQQDAGGKHSDRSAVSRTACLRSCGPRCLPLRRGCGRIPGRRRRHRRCRRRCRRHVGRRRVRRDGRRRLRRWGRRTPRRWVRRRPPRLGGHLRRRRRDGLENRLRANVGTRVLAADLHNDGDDLRVGELVAHVDLAVVVLVHRASVDLDRVRARAGGHATRGAVVLADPHLRVGVGSLDWCCAHEDADSGNAGGCADKEQALSHRCPRGGCPGVHVLLRW
jgi:hypothetical protein